MERRRSRRLSVTVNAAVFYDGRRIGPYRLRDISAGGARLAHGPIMFRPGCEVQIELPGADADEQPSSPRLTATVVHTSGDGIGLAFADVDRDTAPLVAGLARPSARDA